ncbi:multidrug efflux transporter transcriptional repressor AcrR [Pantoea sp. 1.19]|uniref:multidrug efflux transporter transcriptional repressor AcrR n=1 Tax=Pantoea sp. 1.19 TaxID=1925589 RepID=UPI000948B17B|nr:multidrug efflux transporter transcriptional repressor AcrR [Pantoea sp. 1.19]
MARKTKQQALETRHEILDAALACFSAHGVSATSLTDIARRAGVTRGAIYWHFKNKTDLLNEILAHSESGIADVEKEYQLKYPDDPLSVMRDTLIYALAATARDTHRRKLLEVLFHKCEFVGEMVALQQLQQILFLECHDKIIQMLNQCIEAGQLPAALNTRRAAIVLRAYVTGVLENWLFLPESFDMVAEAPAMVQCMIDTLRLSPTLCDQPA